MYEYLVFKIKLQEFVFEYQKCQIGLGVGTIWNWSHRYYPR